jgi:uncharacterized protein (DUF433 family)
VTTAGVASLTIAKDPPVLEKWKDGSIRISGTRIPFDRFVDAYTGGETAAQLRKTFPSLSLATIHRLLAYYLAHQTEVDAWFEQLSKEAEALYAEHSRQTAASRERLKRKLAEARAPAAD